MGGPGGPGGPGGGRFAPGGPGAARVPGLALLGSVPDAVLAPMVVAAVLAVVVHSSYLVRGVPAVRRRNGASRGVALVAAVAAVWLAFLTVMTQTHHSTGALRYLAPFTALLAVLAGCGCAWLARQLGRRPPGRRPVLAAVALAALAATSVAVAVGAARRANDEELRAVGAAQRTAESLRALVAAAGGRAAVNACDPLVTGPYQVPLVAWTLRRHLSSVGYLPGGTGTVVVVQSDPVRLTGLVAARSVERPPWLLRSTCPAAGGAP